MDLTVLIVSYRNPELTRACLASVYAETTGIAFEVIVVDNASGDGTAEMIGIEFPQVRLIALEENIGFARGNNLAAEHARGQYLLLLNPDTIVHDGALQKLLAFARAHPEAGACGGRTIKADGSLEPSSCWGEPSLWSTFCFASGASTAFRGSRIFDPESLGHWQRDSIRSVGVITGCLLAIPRDRWHALGGFDPALFMYGEDVDLSIRISRLGLHLLVTPDATITHLVGASAASTAKKTEMLMRARAALMIKHWNPVARRIGIKLLVVGVALRGLGATLFGGGGASAATGKWVEVWRARADWTRGYPTTPSPLPVAPGTVRGG